MPDLETTDKDAALEGSLIAGVPARVRSRMVSAVSVARSKDHALELAIGILLENGTPEQRSAVVEAFRANTQLAYQWDTAWNELRAQHLNSPNN